MSNAPILKQPGHPTIALPRWLINEKILRAKAAGAKLEDLFLVIPVQAGSEGEIDLDTDFGKLKTFFCSQLKAFQDYGKEKPQALLLHKSKYNYPKVSKVSTRPVHTIHTLH